MAVPDESGQDGTEAFRTEQERFWAGEFGDDYSSRNRNEASVAANLAFFCRALRTAGSVGSCVELGANVGLNLRALRQLFPDIQLSAIEINSHAVLALRPLMSDWGGTLVHSSILDWEPAGQVDLALVKGVLIHLAPEHLHEVYDKLYRASRRYILIAEYYSPTPVSVPYRGHSDRLFKRDFAGEMLDLHPDLELLDYGFVYHRDRLFPQDDINWFLLGRR